MHSDESATRLTLVVLFPLIQYLEMVREACGADCGRIVGRMRFGYKVELEWDMPVYMARNARR